MSNSKLFKLQLFLEVLCPVLFPCVSSSSTTFSVHAQRDLSIVHEKHREGLGDVTDVVCRIEQYMATHYFHHNPHLSHHQIFVNFIEKWGVVWCVCAVCMCARSAAAVSEPIFDFVLANWLTSTTFEEAEVPLTCGHDRSVHYITTYSKDISPWVYGHQQFPDSVVGEIPLFQYPT